MREVADTGLHVHPIGIDGEVFGWTSGASRTAILLDRFAEVGGNLVSTADHYAGGRSEVMIGSWLATLPDRGRMVIATTIGRHPDARGLGARAVVRATEGSLRRLGTDYIDILTLDGEDTTAPIDDTLEALDMLKRSGKVRHIAVSGHSAARIRAVNERAVEAVYPKVTAISQVYSLVQRGVFEREIAPLAVALGVAVFARHPLGNGFLTGEHRDRPPSAEPRAPALSHEGRRGTRVLGALAAVAAEREASMARTALAWVLSKPTVTAALVSFSSADELLDVFDAPGESLTRHQVAVLDRASA